MSTLLLESLRSRIRVINTLWEWAAGDMTLAQVNHHDRAGVLPIAFSFIHVMRGQDDAISTHFLSTDPLWTRGDWADRVGVSVDLYARGAPLSVMEGLRFGDLDAWRGYQSAVIARTNTVVEKLTEAVLAEVAIPNLSQDMQGSFCSLVVGVGNPVRKLDVLEYLVYQHGLRHMGEVEHGRALVGMSGLTG